MTRKKKARADDPGKAELSKSGDSSSPPSLAHPTPKVKSVNVGDETLCVRDRRAPGYFTIDNKLLQQWARVIGVHGLAVYCSLACHANEAEGEKAWPSYDLVCEELDISSATHNRCVRLLACCGLITRGKERTRKGWRNFYHLLQEPDLTADTLAGARLAVEREFSGKCDASFLAATLKRIDAAIDGGTLRRNGGTHYDVTEVPVTRERRYPLRRNGEQPLLEQPEREGKLLEQQQQGAGEKKRGDNGSDGEAVVADDFSQKIELLKALGVTDPALTTTAKGATLDTVKAWCAYASKQDSLRNPAGFVVNRIAKGDPPPADTGQGRAFTKDEYRRHFVQPGERPKSKKITDELWDSAVLGSDLEPAEQAAGE